MNYFPIFVDIKNRPVLVIGGGDIALRKIELLLKASAQVNVVAKALCATLQEHVDNEKVTWLAHTFELNHLDNIYLIVAATNDKALNHQLYLEATKRHILINVVDDREHCSFILPAIVDRSPVMVAISSGGTSPILARMLKEKLETLLPQSLSTVATLLNTWRDIVTKKLVKLSSRRRFWQQLLTGPFMQLVENKQIEQAETLLHTSLHTSLNDDKQQQLLNQGQVTLIGAGPGDPQLLTLKALRIMQQADVVLYDALVSDEVLNLARLEADKIFVGKRASNHRFSQETINQMLIDYAQKGLHVVRLKGGDPFIFGRGGEELQALQLAKIPYQIVPGITAAIGASAYSGIPLTHRDLAHSTTFITGYHTKRTGDINWPVLSQSNHTLVIYMGIIHINEIVQQLTAHGRAITTPIAIVSNATKSNQHVTIGTLANLVALSHTAPSPALIIIGEVASLHQELAWFN